MIRRRRGVGLLGTMAVGGAAYAAGSSAAKGKAAEQAQNQQIADLQAQVNAQPAPQAAAPAPPPPAPAAAAPAAGAASMDEKLAQLQQLAELKTAGVLTDAEFEVQKARILAQ
jgi:hypothetical protein